MNRTIKWVNQRGRLNEKGQYGPKVYINGTFEDGAIWSIGVKPENEAAMMATLNGLVGKEGDFQTKDRINNRGETELTLESWPGKPQSAGYGARGGGGNGGGGPRTYVETWAQSKDGKTADRRSIHKSVALQRAQEFVLAVGQGEKTPAGVLKVATIYFNWLEEGEELPAPKADAPAEQSDAERHAAGLPARESQEYKSFENYLRYVVNEHRDEFPTVAALWQAIKGECAKQGLDTVEKLKACRDLNKFNALKSAVEDKMPVPF